jgi:glycosyltransferase involved in cell wall biosynthesis
LLEDGPARERMSALGKARAAKEFSWETERIKLVEAYGKLLG